MSSYKIIDSLRGKLKRTSEGIALPKVLVTAQFLVAISIFICALVITEQVSYFLKKDLGYDKSFVLTVSSVPRIWSQEGINQMNAAKLEFLKSPYIEAASLSWDIPNGNSGSDARLYRDGSEEEKAVLMPLLKTDEDYASVYQLKVLDGSYLHESRETWQPNTIVINKAAQKALGVNVGDEVRMRGTNNIVYTIRGIINDFHFASLRDDVKPIAIVHTKELNVFRFFSFKLKQGQLSATVNEVHKIWRKVFPDDPFDYAFMDERLEALYKTELQLKKGSAVATGLMLIIVLTGILGIVSLSVSRRTKEIGIRKVLGATVSGILVMISKEYLKLAIIAIALAVPLSYYFISFWLNGFAYHVEISWWMFAFPGFSVVLITLLIVTAQSFKTALLNPSNTLKCE